MNNAIKFPVLVFLLLASILMSAAHATGITVESLKQMKIEPMKDADIRQLVVGNIIVVRNTETLANFAARFDPNGKRILQQVSAQRDGPRIIYKTLGDAKDANIADYEIKNNRLITRFDDQVFEILIFKIKDKYFGARSTDNGELNWELVLITR